MRTELAFGRIPGQANDCAVAIVSSPGALRDVRGVLP